EIDAHEILIGHHRSSRRTNFQRSKLIKMRRRVVFDALPISMVEVKGDLREGVSIVFDRDPTLKFLARKSRPRVFRLLAVDIRGRDFEGEFEIYGLGQGGEVISVDRGRASRAVESRGPGQHHRITVLDHLSVEHLTLVVEIYILRPIGGGDGLEAEGITF